MDNVKKNKWFIAIKERGEYLFDVRDLKIIEPAPGTYHADPFLFRDLIFFELYDYQKGVIAVMDKQGCNIRTILKQPWHLSFPFIIEEGENVYMIPESAPNGTLDLYQCKDFKAQQWEFVKTLLRGAFADTTIIKKDNEFWMFTTEGNNNLRIYKAKAITGPWDLMVSDAYMHSRGAGNIFEMDGKLVRPTQDGEVYGKQIYIKEIGLNPYREKQEDMIYPTWFPGLTGTHTFNFDKTHVVVDGRIKI